MRVLLSRKKSASVQLRLGKRRGELDVWVEGEKITDRKMKRRLIKAWAWMIVYRDAKAFSKMLSTHGCIQKYGDQL